MRTITFEESARKRLTTSNYSKTINEVSKQIDANKNEGETKLGFFYKVMKNSIFIF